MAKHPQNSWMNSESKKNKREGVQTQRIPFFAMCSHAQTMKTIQKTTTGLKQDSSVHPFKAINASVPA